MGFCFVLTQSIWSKNSEIHEYLNWTCAIVPLGVNRQITSPEVRSCGLVSLSESSPALFNSHSDKFWITDTSCIRSMATVYTFLLTIVILFCTDSPFEVKTKWWACSVHTVARSDEPLCHLSLPPQQQNVSGLEEKLRVLRQSRDESQHLCTQQKQNIADLHARLGQQSVEMDTVKRRMDELQQVCVCGWMGGWMDGWMDGWMAGWMDRWIDR